MNNQLNFADLLLKADIALQDGRWADARPLYHQVLDVYPGDNKASQGLHEVDRQEAADREIQRLVISRSELDKK